MTSLSLHAAPTVAVYLLYLVLSLPLFCAAYRLLLHPLRQYPGPLAAKLTDAYGGYWAVRKTYHTTIFDLFRQYGPVVRVAPNRLVFNTSSALQDIYLNPRVVKGQAYHYQPLSTNMRHVANTIDRDVHRRKRRVIGSVLNERSMRIFEPTLSAHVDELLKRLLDNAQKPINMSDPCRYLAMDVATSLAFGHSFNLQTDETYRFFPVTLGSWLRYINANMQLALFRPVSRMMLLLQAKRSIAFGSAIKSLAQKRMALDKDAVHDFYSVANEVDAGAQFFRSEMWAEAGGFLVAGGTTTAASTSAALFYLSRYPDCYRALADEIRSTFASVSDIKSGPQLNSCKYLRACIEETLRCASSALTPLWREQAPDDSGSFIVDGHVIPRGTQVAVPLYSLFHNEDIFAQPYTYIPERWLEPESEKEQARQKTMRKAFVPFLVGDRACAGKAMAWTELNITIARIMWCFDFEKAPGNASKLGEELHFEADREVPTYKVRDIFVAEHDGPNLVFRARDKYTQELRATLQ